MALKQGHSAEQTAELAIDDLGLDLASLGPMPRKNFGMNLSEGRELLIDGARDDSMQILTTAFE